MPLMTWRQNHPGLREGPPSYDWRSPNKRREDGETREKMEERQRQRQRSEGRCCTPRGPRVPRSLKRGGRIRSQNLRGGTTALTGTCVKLAVGGSLRDSPTQQTGSVAGAVPESQHNVTGINKRVTLGGSRLHCTGCVWSTKDSSDIHSIPPRAPFRDVNKASPDRRTSS